ncbi:hypothetical protein BDW66DRAFT_149877 [Aspergillus desertorum]
MIRYLAHVGMHEMIARCQHLELKQLQNSKTELYPQRTPNAVSTVSMELGILPRAKGPRERYQQVDAVPYQSRSSGLFVPFGSFCSFRELHSVVAGLSPRWNSPSAEVSRLQNMHLEEYGHVL